MWVLLRKPRTEQFTPLKAIPAIAAESISILLGIIKFMDTVCHNISLKRGNRGAYSSVSSFALHSHRQTQIDLKSTVFTMLYQHFSAVCKYDLFDNEQS